MRLGVVTPLLYIVYKITLAEHAVDIDVNICMAGADWVASCIMFFRGLLQCRQVGRTGDIYMGKQRGLWLSLVIIITASSADCVGSKGD